MPNAVINHLKEKRVSNLGLTRQATHPEKILNKSMNLIDNKRSGRDINETV